MRFIYPEFLFALLAIIIPIIIHLFNFRKFKRIYFTNVLFLKEVKKETTSKSKLKHLLVLISRILAIAFLVFAFAQPYLPKDKIKKIHDKKIVSIYIDNSFSMSAQMDDVSVLERAKKVASEIVEAHKDNSGWQLITNHIDDTRKRTLNKEEILDRIDDIQTSPNVSPISKIASIQRQLLDGHKVTHVISYLISDFQKSTADFDHMVRDTGMSVNLIPIQSRITNNLFIDSIWFYAPRQTLNQANSLIVRIKNAGEEDVENSRLSLKLNGQTKAIADINIKAESMTLDTLTFTINKTGWHQAVLSVTDYPVSFDDTYYFTFSLADEISILTINEDQENPYINALFSGDPYFNLRNVYIGQLNYSLIASNKLIILNNLMSIPSGMANELNKYITEGGNLLIFPNPKMDISSMSVFLKSVNSNSYIGMINDEKKISYLNMEQEIFRDVFEELPKNINLPIAKHSFLFDANTRTNEEAILKFKDGSSFLSKYKKGRGNLYLCAVPLDVNYCDLPIHAIFAPLVYRIAITGSKEQQISYVIGDDNVIRIENTLSDKELVYRIKGSDVEFIPEQKMLISEVSLSLHDQIKESGIYSIYTTLNTNQSLVAFNFSRKESELDYYNSEEIKERVDDLGFEILEVEHRDPDQLRGEINKGVILWKLCIIFALLFIGVEGLLLRFL